MGMVPRNERSELGKRSSLAGGNFFSGTSIIHSLQRETGRFLPEKEEGFFTEVAQLVSWLQAGGGFLFLTDHSA